MKYYLSAARIHINSFCEGSLRTRMRGLFPQIVRGSFLDQNLIDKVQSFPPARDKEAGRIDVNDASKSIELLKLEQLAQSPLLKGVSAEELDKFFKYIDNASSRPFSNISLENLRYAIRESFSLPNLGASNLVEEKIRSLLNIFDYVYKNAAKPDDLLKDTFLNTERHLVNLNRGIKDKRGPRILIKGLKADLRNYFRRTKGFFTEGGKSQILELAKNYAEENRDLSKGAVSNPPSIESFDDFKSISSDPFDDALTEGAFAAYENGGELIKVFLNGLEKLLERKQNWDKEFEQNYLNNIGNALELIAKKYPGCRSKASDLRINIYQRLPKA